MEHLVQIRTLKCSDGLTDSLLKVLIEGSRSLETSLGETVIVCGCVLWIHILEFHLELSFESFEHRIIYHAFFGVSRENLAQLNWLVGV